MSDSTSRLEIYVTADTQQAVKGLGDVSQGLGLVGSLAGGVATAGLAALTAGLAGAAVSLAGFGALLATGLKTAITEAMGAEEQLSQLKSVLESTGFAAGMTVDDLKLLASGLQNLTAFTDEQVQSVEEMLLTFTSIHKEIFPRTTEAALDLATRFKMDLSGASIMLGKALQDPIEGMGALRRVGVTFNDAEQETINKLIEANDLLGAQGVILDAVERQAKGAAETYANTLGGSFEQFKNQVGEIFEGIGEKLLPPLTDAFNEMKPSLLSMASTIGSIFTDKTFTDTFKSAVDGIASAIKTVTPIVNTLIGAFKQFFTDIMNGMSPFEALRNSFGDLIPSNFQGLFNAVLDTFRNLELLLRRPDIQNALSGIGGSLKGAMDQNIPLIVSNLTQQFRMFSDLISRSGPIIVTILNAVADAIKGIGKIAEISLIMKQVNTPGRIPGLATGVTNFEGGLAMVGERGPELVYLPQGTNVIPNQGGGNSTSTSNQQNFYGAHIYPQTLIPSMSEIMDQMNTMAGF